MYSNMKVTPLTGKENSKGSSEREISGQRKTPVIEEDGERPEL